MLTFPSLVLGLVMALLVGALFHLWQGGGGGRLLLYLALSLVGFGAGHLLGIRAHWILVSVGPLDLGTAVIGSLLLLGLGHWLVRLGHSPPSD